MEKTSVWIPENYQWRQDVRGHISRGRKNLLGEPDILIHFPLEASFTVKAAQKIDQEVEQEAVTKVLRRLSVLVSDLWGWGEK